MLVAAVGDKVKLYYQEPRNTTMTYPCIVYKIDGGSVDFAGNNPYRRSKRFQVTVIDRDPDSPLPGLIETLPTCVHQRRFVTDNLNHDVYNVDI